MMSRTSSRQSSACLIRKSMIWYSVSSRAFEKISNDFMFNGSCDLMLLAFCSRPVAFFGHRDNSLLGNNQTSKSQNDALRICISAHISLTINTEKHWYTHLLCTLCRTCTELCRFCSALHLFARLCTEPRSVVLKEGATGTRRSCGACGSKHRHGPVRVPEGLRTCTQDQDRSRQIKIKFVNQAAQLKYI